MKPPATVLVADAQPMFAHALGTALGAEPDIVVLPVMPRTGAETVEAIVRSRPDVSLVDFWLPDLLGPDLVAQVLDRAPGRKVILLSWLHSFQHVTGAMGAGAAGFLPKSLRLAQVSAAVRQAMAGRVPFQSELEELVASLRERSTDVGLADRFAALTPGEIDVLANLSLGRSTAEMAALLHLAQATIKNRVHSILTKLGARTRGEAVAMARAAGFLASGHTAAVRRDPEI